MKRVTLILLCILCVWFLAAGAGSLLAAPFTPGNILVSSENILYEFTFEGDWVQQVEIPEPPGCCGYSRDLIAISGGNVAVFNGTFSPILSLYDAEQELWSARTTQGWSTANNVSYGGIAVHGDSIFVTDMDTANGPEKGIVRFNLSDETVERYFLEIEYIDLYVGLDNKLYALRNVFGDLDVINLQTMTLEYSLELGHVLDIRGIAVNSSGHIYAASFNDSIYHYDSSGVIVGSIATGVSDLTDIDINSSGEIIVGSRFGEIITTDEMLSSVDVFTIPGSNPGGSFVAHFNPDVVTITEAKYRADRDEFKVKAKSSEQPDAVLTVVDFGEMTFKKDKYELKIKPLSPREPPQSVRVVSSLGGTATLPVEGVPQGPTLPDSATDPSPSNGAVDVSVNMTLSWAPGSGAESHDIYFGACPSPPFVESRHGTTYVPASLDNQTNYCWRIDEVNEHGTTPGAVWSFTTASELPSDEVRITKAEWKADRLELKVEATSSEQPDVTLEVVGFGEMIFKKGKYQYKVKPELNPGTVTVISSQGGSATATIRVR
ncbi:MAG: hypothetical protein V3W14_13915 [Candidatus Neomarinimicrobiota bacterium]